MKFYERLIQNFRIKDIELILELITRISSNETFNSALPLCRDNDEK